MHALKRETLPMKAFTKSLFSLSWRFLSECQTICFMASLKKKEPKAFRLSSSFHRIPVLHLKSRSMKVQLAPRTARIPFTYRAPMDPVKQPSAISAGSHGVCTNTLPSQYLFLHSSNTHMVFPVSLLHRGNKKRLLRYNPFFTPLSTLHLWKPIKNCSCKGAHLITETYLVRYARTLTCLPVSGCSFIEACFNHFWLSVAKIIIVSLLAKNILFCILGCLSIGRHGEVSDSI